MKIIFFIFLFFKSIIAQKPINIFGKYGFDNTSSVLLMKYINNMDYHFIYDDYNYYILNSKTGYKIDFNRTFNPYKEGSFKHIKDMYLINGYAYKLKKIQNTIKNSPEELTQNNDILLNYFVEKVKNC